MKNSVHKTGESGLRQVKPNYKVRSVLEVRFGGHVKWLGYFNRPFRRRI